MLKSEWRVAVAASIQNSAFIIQHFLSVSRGGSGRDGLIGDEKCDASGGASFRTRRCRGRIRWIMSAADRGDSSSVRSSASTFPQGMESGNGMSALSPVSMNCERKIRQSNNLQPGSPVKIMAACGSCGFCRLRLRRSVMPRTPTSPIAARPICKAASSGDDGCAV